MVAFPFLPSMPPAAHKVLVQQKPEPSVLLLVLLTVKFSSRVGPAILPKARIQNRLMVLVKKDEPVHPSRFSSHQHLDKPRLGSDPNSLNLLLRFVLFRF